MSSVFFKVPAKDLAEEWTRQLEEIKKELVPTKARQAELKSKDLSDSCINGKVEYGEVMIRVLELKLRYLDLEDDFVMDEHTLTQYFDSRNRAGLDNIGGPAQTERKY